MGGEKKNLNIWNISGNLLNFHLKFDKLDVLFFYTTANM